MTKTEKLKLLRRACDDLLLAKRAVQRATKNARGGGWQEDPRFCEIEKLLHALGYQVEHDGVHTLAHEIDQERVRYLGLHERDVQELSLPKNTLVAVSTPTSLPGAAHRDLIDEMRQPREGWRPIGLSANPDFPEDNALVDHTALPCGAGFHAHETEDQRSACETRSANDNDYPE